MKRGACFVLGGMLLLGWVRPVAAYDDEVCIINGAPGAGHDELIAEWNRLKPKVNALLDLCVTGQGRKRQRPPHQGRCHAAL